MAKVNVSSYEEVIECIKKSSKHFYRVIELIKEIRSDVSELQNSDLTKEQIIQMRVKISENKKLLILHLRSNFMPISSLDLFNEELIYKKIIEPFS